MARPIRFFEDLVPGAVFAYGAYEMTEAEIIAFASKFDPQSFHTDPEAAKSSNFGGLAASGWHTASAAMRMLVDHHLSPESSMGSPGIDELRWTKPVRPGDVLSLRITVQEAIPSRSKPDRGIVKSFTEVLNQHGEVVMTMRGMTMLRRRVPG